MSKKPMVVVDGAEAFNSLEDIVAKYDDLTKFIKEFNIEGRVIRRLVYYPDGKKDDDGNVIKDEDENIVKWDILEVPLSEITKAMVKKGEKS